MLQMQLQMNVVLDNRTVLSSQAVLSAIVVSLPDPLLSTFATQHIIWRVPDPENAKVMAIGVEVLHSVLKVLYNDSHDSRTCYYVHCNNS